jgi:hypothetical protein
VKIRRIYVTQIEIRICEVCRGKYPVKRSQAKAYGSKFCGKDCFGVSRRKNLTDAERKELKRLYDIEYRKNDRERRLRKKREQYHKNRERVLAEMRQRRQTAKYKRRMRRYLKRYWSPDKKEEKKDYDRKFRAMKKFGPLWESHYLTVLLNEEVKKRMTNYEIRLRNNTLNKALKRGRHAEAKRGYS